MTEDDFALNKLLARNSPSNETDVLTVKNLLNKVGYYDEPDYGITPYPDGRLLQSIAKFQKDHELTVDGWMRPGGDVLMAKRAMGALGYYPKRLLLDPTAIVDRELHTGITKFQLDNKLYSDGWMGPGGETAKAVRDALHRRGDKGVDRPLGPSLLDERDPIHLANDDSGAEAEEKVSPGAEPEVDMRGHRISAGTDGGDTGKGGDEGSKKPTIARPDILEGLYRLGAKAAGYFPGDKLGPRLLEHYLDGSGEKFDIPPDEERGKKPVQEAEAENRQRIEDSFTKERATNILPGKLKYMKDGESIELKDHFDRKIHSSDLVKRGEIDFWLATGTSNVKSEGNYTATKEGDTIHIQGTVTHKLDDTYNFDKGRAFSRDAQILEQFRTANPFKVESVWEQRINGTVTLVEAANGTTYLTNPDFRWQDIKK